MTTDEHKENIAMDAGEVSNPKAEASINLLREHRDEMARWLAIEVLALDPVVSEDLVLVDRLLACQEHLEKRLRAKSAVMVDHQEVPSTPNDPPSSRSLGRLVGEFGADA
jgi:hypothetical protein